VYLAEILLQNLVLGTQILMVAVAMYLVYAASRVIHIAIGAIGAAAAYALYFGTISGWPLWAGILFAIFIAALLGLFSAKILEDFAARREPLMGLLVSIAMILVFEACIAIFFGTDGKNLQIGVLSVTNIAGAQIDVPGVITIVAGAALSLLLWSVVRFTRIGRLLRSVAENPSLATSLGINNAGVRRWVYIAAALVAALIISLAGWHTALTPSIGFYSAVSAFIALLMGGTSDLRGTVIASYVLAIIPGLIIGFTSQFSENWRLVFVFLIAAIVLAFRPNGIFSKHLREA
jgi:branched-subunit amino acid ABC-type transport system permease component